MLKLNKEKENELIKYGFEKDVRNYDNSYYFKFGKNFFIEGFASKKENNNGYISMSSFSKQNQDVVYELIKNDILVKVENPTKTKQQLEKERMENKIKEMENKIKDLEEKINDNSRAE